MGAGPTARARVCERRVAETGAKLEERLARVVSVPVARYDHRGGVRMCVDGYACMDGWMCRVRRVVWCGRVRVCVCVCVCVCA